MLIGMNKPFLRLRAALTVTFALSVLVVFAGATVRATGAGMGCPDWPLCYGQLIPPTSADQLAPDYATHYAVAGRPATFDAVLTYIEYVNRLLGALTGLSMLVTAVLTAWTVRRSPVLGWLVLSSLLVLFFVAWLGANVVGTFLAPYAVTLHLLSAYLLLGLLLAALEVTARVLHGPRAPVKRSTVAALVLVGTAFLVQWTLGIRTCEEVEAVIWDHDLAETVFEALGGAYPLHRIAGFLVAAAAAFLGWLGWKTRRAAPRLFQLTALVAILVVLQGLIGLVLWFGGLPDWAKPLHLVVATGAWCAWAATVLYSVPSRPHAV